MSTFYPVFLFALLLSFPLQAQFRLIGAADYMAGECIQLTPDEQYSSGMAYHKRKLDLSRYFEIEFDVYFGDKDLLGADGITFVIHNDPRGYDAYGTWGEGLGYNRIYPSIAVEFDTYQNYYRNDPACDHAAYLENGVVYQDEYWNNNDEEYNLEDDLLHNFRFQWNPDEKSLTFYLDNSIVFQGVRDLVNDIFEGETQVIWGFTASTGRKHNLQYFCLKKWTRRTPIPLEEKEADTQFALNTNPPEQPLKKIAAQTIVTKETDDFSGSSPQGRKVVARKKD